VRPRLAALALGACASALLGAVASVRLGAQPRPAPLAATSPRAPARWADSVICVDPGGAAWCLVQIPPLAPAHRVWAVLTVPPSGARTAVLTAAPAPRTPEDVAEAHHYALFGTGALDGYWDGRTTADPAAGGASGTGPSGFTAPSPFSGAATGSLNPHLNPPVAFGNNGCVDEGCSRVIRDIVWMYRKQLLRRGRVRATARATV
jgi:hypothetical protein